MKKVLVYWYGDGNWDEYDSKEEVEEEIYDVLVSDPIDIVFIGIKEDGTKVHLYPDISIKLEEDLPLTEEEERELGIDSI